MILLALNPCVERSTVPYRLIDITWLGFKFSVKYVPNRANLAGMHLCTRWFESCKVEANEVLIGRCMVVSYLANSTHLCDSD